MWVLEYNAASSITIAVGLKVHRQKLKPSAYAPVDPGIQM